MSSSNKTALPIFIGVTFFLLLLATGLANALPSSEDINGLAEKAKQAADTFMQESFELRMKYEYSGQFLTLDDKENLRKLAKRASNHLEAIEKNQQRLKQQIEDYEGDDWDAKYGVSGLWRKLFAELYTTTLSKCQVDFYLALTAEQPQQKNNLHKILAQIDSLERTYRSADSQFLRANVMALLSQVEPAYKLSAINQLDSLMAQEDVRDALYFRAVIKKIKLEGQTKPGQLNSLSEELAQSSCASDLELILSLAFLQQQLNQPEAFEKTVHIWPQIEDFVGSLILSSLSNAIEQGQADKQRQISVFEAELAVQVAWKNKPEDYKMLLDYLSNTKKFQTPLILYTTAVTFAESSPTKAINLLVKASSLQKLQKSDKLETSAYKIAREAAQLAYNLFVQDPANCQSAIEAFENYCTMAGNKINEELEYLYTIILNDCGQAAKSKELLEKIAARPTGNWRNRARLDLIIQQIQQDSLENQDRRDEVLKQLSNLIAECTGQNKKQNKIRTEALTIYCQLLLEKEDKSSAQKVLNILSEEKPDWNLTLTQIKAKALRLMGRLDEAASCLVEGIIVDSGSLSGEVMELLSQAICCIDRLQTKNGNSDSDKVIQNLHELAEFCHRCFNSRKSGLLLAEITIFAANKERQNLLEAEKILENLAQKDGRDVDSLRCRARLLGEQSKFEEAAGLWAKVCEIRKNEAPEMNQKSWKWWRAKFYELHCWAECPQTKKADVWHTIEVLENSFTDIPSLWAEKLNSLKQQCLR